MERQGVSTGLAAAVLGGVTGLQTTLSGLQPGLEFRTAVQYVQEQQQQQQLNSTSTTTTTSTAAAKGKGRDSRMMMQIQTTHIVLADQNVHDTLAQVGTLPQIAATLWHTWWTDGWEASFGREAVALQRAVFGGGSSSSTGTTSPASPRLDLRRFCTRSPAVVRDMIRLLVPPMVVAQLFVVAVPTLVSTLAMSWASGNEENGLVQVVPSSWMTMTTMMDPLTTMSSSSTVATTTMSSLVLVVGLLCNALLLALGYLSIALPAVQVILRNRDDHLTQGIRQACMVAAAAATTTNSRSSRRRRGREYDDDNDDHTQNHSQQQPRPGRVVAVLGLLHVNGIGDRLQTATTANTWTHQNNSYIPNEQGQNR